VDTTGGLPDPRRDERVGELSEDAVDVADPLREVRAWVAAALADALPEATAMTLATVDGAGVPDARVVLLKGLDDRGVWWFSNRRSAKGQQLAERPVAAAVLFWPQLQRLVRLRGRVEHLPDDESDAYFATRPRAAQLGAWASDQSSPIADRQALEERLLAVEQRFADGPVPRPPHWGGELLRPDAVELWQGRAARLHDRLRYLRTVDGWRLERLMP
jgi:pyridoxamine 5'-phosphate oxidase